MTTTFSVNGDSYTMSRQDTRLSVTGPGVAQTWFKLRQGGYLDVDGQAYDEVVISSIELEPGYQRKGLATAIVRQLALVCPKALFSVENPNDQATLWHTNRLNQVLPTRMTLDGQRVTPGQPLE